jgi:hypothetical protein
VMFHITVLLSPVFFFPLDPNIHFSTLFSNTLSLFSFLNVRDQISHPYITTGKSSFCVFQFLRLYILYIYIHI